MSQRSKRMFVVLVGLGVASSAWAAGSAAVRTEKAVGPHVSEAVRTQKAVGPEFKNGGGSAVRTQKAVGPLSSGDDRAVRTQKAVGPLSSGDDRRCARRRPWGRSSGDIGRCARRRPWVRSVAVMKGGAHGEGRGSAR